MRGIGHRPALVPNGVSLLCVLWLGGCWLGHDRSEPTCLGGPVDYETSHLLGELDPGRYTVRIDGMERTFTVP